MLTTLDDHKMNLPQIILMNSSLINPLCKHKVAYRFLVALMYFLIMSLVGHKAFLMSVSDSVIP